MVANADIHRASEVIDIVVIEDQSTVRDCIRKALVGDSEIRIVGEAESGEEGISLIAQLKPHVVLTDIRLGKVNGIEVSRATRDVAPSSKVVVLSAYDDEQYVKALVRTGVRGYLLKDASPEEVRGAVKDVAKGWLVFAPRVAGKVARLLAGEVRLNAEARPERGALTERETEVLQHIVDCAKNSELSELMNISIRTVEVHIKNILLKLGARDRTEAVLLGLQRGLVAMRGSRASLSPSPRKLKASRVIDRVTAGNRAK